MSWLARLLRCSEGRAYTGVIAVVTAIVLTAFTVPAVLNHRPPAAGKPIPFKDFTGSDTAAPLTIEESGYASATPGHATVANPLLPVTAEAGAVTKLSFVRLAGQARVLHLKVDPGTGSSGASPRVLMCPIQSDSWVPERDVPLAAAPPYDCGTAALGLIGPDTNWTFDLGGFTNRASSKGFALVPALPSATTFSVTFVPES